MRAAAVCRTPTPPTSRRRCCDRSRPQREVFCGGSGIAEYRGDSPSARVVQKLIRDMAAAGKLVTSMGNGSLILADSGQLTGKQATSYTFDESRSELEAAGVRWVDQPVVKQDHLVIGRNPDDVHEFSRVLIDRLAKRRN